MDTETPNSNTSICLTLELEFYQKTKLKVNFVIVLKRSEDLIAKCVVDFFKEKYRHFGKKAKTVQMVLKFQRMFLVSRTRRESTSSMRLTKA